MLLLSNARRVAGWLAATAVLISVVSVGFRLYALRPDVAAALEAGHATGFLGYQQLLPVVDTDAEANLPTWLTSAVLLLAALVMWGITKSSDPAVAPWRRHWRLLAGIFVLMSLDEVAQLHDILSLVAARLTATTGILRFGWVIFAVPLVAAFAVAYFRFLRGLADGTRRLVVLSGVCYVGGALGMEMVGGWVADHLGGLSTPAYVLCTSVEELLEMLGVTLFFYAVASRSTDTVDETQSGRAALAAGR